MTLLRGANVVFFHGMKGEQLWKAGLKDLFCGMGARVSRITEGVLYPKDPEDLFTVLNEHWDEVATWGRDEGEVSDIFVFMPEFVFNPIPSKERLDYIVGEYERLLAVCDTHVAKLFVHLTPLAISCEDFRNRMLVDWLLCSYSSLLPNVVVGEILTEKAGGFKDFLNLAVRDWLGSIPQIAGLPAYAYRARE